VVVCYLTTQFIHLLLAMCMVHFRKRTAMFHIVNSVMHTIKKQSLWVCYLVSMFKCVNPRDYAIIAKAVIDLITAVSTDGHNVCQNAVGGALVKRVFRSSNTPHFFQKLLHKKSEFLRGFHKYEFKFRNQIQRIPN